MLSSLKERISSGEKSLKELLKTKKNQEDPEVQRARKRLADDLLELMKGDEGDDDKYVDKLWKLCYHKKIDDFRKRIAGSGAGAGQKKLVSEFRQFLGETARAFEDLVEHIHKKQTLTRLYICLGDIARYKEMVSDAEEKRWSEAAEWYRRAAQLCKESGFAQNQLAVVSSYQQRHVISVYRYERAIACEKPFDAAKDNLAQVLEEFTSSEIKGNPQEAFLSRCLRLQAYLLLPAPKVDVIVAEGDLKFFQTSVSTMLSKHFRSDIVISLFMTFAFSAIYGQTLGLPPDKSKKTTAIAAVNSFCFWYIEHICVGLESKLSILNSQSDLLKRKELLRWVSKALFPLTLMCQVFQSHELTLLDRHAKHKFEELDQMLSSLSTSDVAIDPSVLDEDEAEFAGFFLLGDGFNAKHTEMTTAPSCERRVSKVKKFVRNFVENDVRDLATEEAIFSTHSLNFAPPDSTIDEDDDEEEILFQPKFSTAKLNDNQNGHLDDPSSVNFPSLPLLHAFSSNAGGVSWGNGISYPYMNNHPVSSSGLSVADPFAWVSSQQWVPASTVGQAPSQSPPPVGRHSSSENPVMRLLSPPPGFNQ